VGQHDAAIDVADGVDVRRAGLKPVVHHDIASTVGLDTHRIQTDALGVRLPPDRHQHLLCRDLTASLDVGRDVVGGVLGDTVHFGLQ
jgi:hypothetical protein